jgi:hypothetical protein
MMLLRFIPTTTSASNCFRQTIRQLPTLPSSPVSAAAKATPQTPPLPSSSVPPTTITTSRDLPWQVQLRFIPNQHQRKQLLPHTITTTNTTTTSSTNSSNSNATTDIVKLSNNNHSQQLTVSMPSQVQLRVVQIVLSHAESTTTLARVPTTRTAFARLHCIA